MGKRIRWFMAGAVLGTALGAAGFYYVEHYVWPRYIRPLFYEAKEKANQAKKSIDDNVDKAYRLVDKK
ncbi:hypothetical protein KY311_02200 [Candidatus Woesearchaeota archaeon]|nr:hypothetical protein [Candidatus Woesearchaeota archaeon]